MANNPQFMHDTFKVFHGYDVEDQAVYVKFNKPTDVLKTIDRAVYFQLKSENVISDDVHVSNDNVAKFLALFGGAILPAGTNVDAYEIDMYHMRESKLSYFVKDGSYSGLYNFHEMASRSKAEKIINQMKDSLDI